MNDPSKRSDFLGDRLKVRTRGGIRHDLIDAVFSLAAGRFRSLLALCEGAPAFVESPRAPTPAATSAPPHSQKRKGRRVAARHRLYAPQVEESELDDALDAVEPKVKAALEDEDYERAMAALASLRGPVDAFFDKVIVNDPVPARREVRLNLLARMRDAVHRVADFSRIEG